MNNDSGAGKPKRFAFSERTQRFEWRDRLMAHRHNVGFLEITDGLATHRARREIVNLFALAAPKKDWDELRSRWYFGNWL
jgi:hypothetical protein